MACGMLGENKVQVTCKIVITKLARINRRVGWHLDTRQGLAMRCRPFVSDLEANQGSGKVCIYIRLSGEVGVWAKQRRIKN